MTSDIFDTFKDQFTNDVSQLETLLTDLFNPETFEEAINALFRIFHNHKAITGYLNLMEIHDCAKKAEAVLNILRRNGFIHDTSQLDWLFVLADQMQSWANELDLGVTDLSPANHQIFDMIKLKEPKIAVSKTLSRLTLLYIDNDESYSQKYIPVFNMIFADIFFLATMESLEIAIETYNPDVIMVTHNMIDKKTFTALHNQTKVIPAIALVKNPTQRAIMKLINQDIHYHLELPITSNDLKKVLHSIVNSHFSDRKLLITNKKIRNFIESLDPLNETILKIQQICNDDQKSIADLIKVVKSDPITSGLILNATQSPIYALKQITSIDQAVTIFGKVTVKALTLGGLSSQFKPYDLSVYGITEAIFSDIAHLRLKLMINWFKRVDASMLDTLSVAALLGNLGQILIANEIKNLGLEERFLETIDYKGAHEAEYDYLRTSTAAVTSDILYFWKMPSTLIDAVSYSEFPQDAVEEIRPLATAVHVIYTLVPLTQAKIQPLNPTLIHLIQEAGLKISALEAAIQETL